MIGIRLFLLLLGFYICIAYASPIKDLPDASMKSRQAVKAKTFDDILTTNADNQGLFEGDIVLPFQRNAIADKSTRWPSTIPYVINGEFGHETRSLILASLNELEARTCLTFTERMSETDYLFYKIDSGCFSNVGRVGGKQTVSIGVGCDNHRTIIHETLHALGFWHEQSRTDRDDYVTIVWDVISEGNAHNFNKYDSDQLDTQGVPYDYDSIMHYHDTAFSKNGSRTIIAPAEKTATMGRMEAMSHIDVEELNKLYECQVNIDGNGYTQWSQWGLCDQNCNRIRQRFCDGDQCSTWGTIETDSGSCDNCEAGYDPDCASTTVEGGSGTVSSPLYPYAYKSNAECIQTIKTPSGSRVRLDFQDMDIEHSNGECHYDFLHIYDGPDDSSPKLATYCGDTLPSSVFASGNVLTVKFISDYSVVQNGFYANFNAMYGNLHFCAFEHPKDLCGWTMDSSTELTFQSHMGSTSSIETGPSTDHTFDSSQGQYLYMESSSPAAAGQRARLISPFLHDAFGNKSCFSVWYNMYGINTGSLSIYMVNDDETINPSPLKTISGDKGNDLWYQLSVTITKSTPFKVAVEAVRGNGYRGDIGIDDVTLNPGNCP